MPRITPITHSFSMGELSPLMFGRSDLEGYSEGVASMENLFPDSRGPAISRRGTKFVQSFEATTGRVLPLPVNENFFYTAVFLENRLIISSASGHVPVEVLSQNPHFNSLGNHWTTSVDVDLDSVVVFTPSRCFMQVEDLPNRHATITQEVTGLVINTDYSMIWDLIGDNTGRVRVGTAALLGDLFDEATTPLGNDATFNTGPNTSVWISIVLDSDVFQGDQSLVIDFFGLAELDASSLEFETPYLASDLESIQTAQAPQGDAVYILQGRHPVHKLEYDKVLDAFEWSQVEFIDPPEEWTAESYPVTGSFFQGRLWLGGPPNDQQTLWASKSGLPEDFTQGALADDALQFTLAKFGAIRWMAGFKNLMIGTIYAEHIVTSEGLFIAPQDINIEQQSAYGSAPIQPVQVGDQIFYVSADRRKLRAIQYEWQADNWLSQDLTFNSEHITLAGVKYIAWHQNPKNLLHCVLQDGTVATMTYERSSDKYGWSRVVMQGQIVDITSAPVQGTDYIHGLIFHGDDKLYLETQAQLPEFAFMDSWIRRVINIGSGVIDGLEHLEGMTVQSTINGAMQPEYVVENGEIPGNTSEDGYAEIGLKFTRRLVTLPFEGDVGEGSNAPYAKRWSKIYVRVISSAKPVINGERPASRHPSTPMNSVEPERSEDIEVSGLGFDKVAIVRIEQELPFDLTIIALFGKMGTSIT